ncbi:MAG: oligosaccharide flippase family protein [Clostridia bacterium]
MKSKFIKNFSFLAISLFTIKLLGGLYRIPLANFLDADGMGLYQMVFPLFSLFLTITSSAIPSAISKMTSDSRGDETQIASVYKTARKYVFWGSLTASVALILLSAQFAKLQGNANAQIPYVLIAPSVFFVGYISLYRGIYQGKLNMRPTAISQIIEQVVKIGFGLTFAYILRKNTLYAAYGTVFAVTLSELVTVLYIKIKAKDIKLKKIGEFDKNISKRLLALAVPMTISFSLTPLITIVESRLILSNAFSALGALSDFGLYQGCAITLVSVPIALISALGVVLIPYLENSKKDVFSISLRFALVILPIFALGFFFFSDSVANTFFSKFDGVEKSTLAMLIKFSSLTIIFQGLHVLTTSTLYGMNRAKIPLVSLLVGGVLKIVTLLVALPKYGIIVAVFSDWVCYFVALCVNLIYIIVRRKIQLHKRLFVSLGILYALCAAELFVVSNLLVGFVGILIGGVCVLATTIVSLCLTYILSPNEKDEMLNILRKKTTES